MSIISRIKSWFEPKPPEMPDKKVVIRFKNSGVISYSSPRNITEEMQIKLTGFVVANKDKAAEARKRDYLREMARNQQAALNYSGQELGRASQRRGNPHDFDWGRW